MKRVVITGLGTVNPLGSTVEKFWENVKKGTLGVSKIDSFDTTELGVSVADFDPAEYFERKDIRHMERFTQIAVASAIQALQDAGTDFKDMDPYRVGTIIGCGIGGIGRIEEEHDKYRAKGPGRISPFFVPMMIGNMAAAPASAATTSAPPLPVHRRLTPLAKRSARSRTAIWTFASAAAANPPLPNSHWAASAP